MKEQRRIPEKGPGRFVYVLYEYFGRFVLLNLIFILFSLPLLTLPAAYAALLQLVRRLTQMKHVEIWSDFVAAFRENWRQATVFGLPHGLALGLVGYSALLYVENMGLNPWMWLFLCCSCLLFLFLSLMGMYVYLQIASVALPLRHMMGNACRLAAAKPLRGCAALCVSAFTLLLGPFFLPVSLFYMLLFMAAFQAYCLVWLLYPVMERYVCPPNIE